MGCLAALEASVMRPIERPSRRALLWTGLLGGGTLLAGCMESPGSPSDNSSTQEATSSSNGVFSGTSFDGQDLVVHLRDGHDVTQVNLIAPDGTAFAEKAVATGATTVRIQILDMRPGIALYDHYIPGEYELLALASGDPTSMSLQIEPLLQITNIRQIQDGERARDFARIEVEIENIGTGPTWPYQITFKDAPNRTVNDDLKESPGIPWLENQEATDLIALPGQTKLITDLGTPLRFSRDERETCEGSITFYVIVGTAVGDPLVQKVRATLGGESHWAGISESFVCKDISLTLVDAGETDDEGS